MICNNCGKTLPDGSAFCDGCGASLANGIPAQPPVQPNYQPYPPAQPNYPPYPPQQMYYAPPDPTFSNFFTTLKGIFSRNAVVAVANSAKSTTNEWILSLIAFVLLFGLSPMLFLMEEVNGALGGLLKVDANGKVFLFAALLGLLAVTASVLTIYGFVKGVYRKAISPIQVLNMVGASTMPLSLALIFNMINGLFGGFGLGLAIVLLAIATMMCALLAYEGMQSFEPLGFKPLFAFIGSCSTVTIIIVLFGWLFTKAL